MADVFKSQMRFADFLIALQCCDQDDLKHLTRNEVMRQNKGLCVEEGDWVTLFSYEDNEIYELHIGEHYDSYLEKLCLGKRERDIVSQTPKYEIQYVMHIPQELRIRSSGICSGSSF